MSKQEPLRFAALIRVSSEQQEKRGDSLQVQRQQIDDTVQRLGGAVTIYYSGQEHATPGYERERLDKLLQDASRPRRKFDAVMVADSSRWSRDNLKSEEGLRILHENGIRFFCLSTEYDLNDRQARMILGLQAVFNQYNANTLSDKALSSKVERAKRGELSVGERPYGRVYDKKNRAWSLDEDKATRIQQIAKRFIAGERLEDLSTEFSIGRSHVHKILRGRCGSKWTVSIGGEEFTYNIPPLLDDETIAAVHRQLEANKTYKHGRKRDRYLLSRMVMCGICKRAMGGVTTEGHRYYQHSYVETTGKGRVENCLDGMVRADELEDAVMRQLFETFGNPEAMQRAIEAATPDREKMEELREELEQIDKNLKGIEAKRERLVDAIGDGTLQKNHVKKKMGKLDEQEGQLFERQGVIHEELDRIPLPDRIKTVTELAGQIFRPKVSAKERLSKRRYLSYDEMTREEKRALAELAFGGKLPDGRRMGVYIYPIEAEQGRKRRRWRYEILGHLIEARGVSFANLECDPMDGDNLVFTGGPEQQEELISKSSRSSTPRSETSTSFRSANRELRTAGSTSAGPACASAASWPAPVCGQPCACCTPCKPAHSCPTATGRLGHAGRRGRASTRPCQAAHRSTGTCSGHA
jgi:site-specific DNA recombinase